VIQAIQKRLRNDEEGFTLIELMVVVLIIAILIAIAIPTFLGARTRAQDRAAQSDLRNGLVAAEVHYVDTEDYETADAAALLAIEPQLVFVDGSTVSTTAPFQVGVVTTAGVNAVQLVRASASGTYFCIQKAATTGTGYGSGADAATALGDCGNASW